MDPERDRIQADLRGLLEGEVRCDDLFLRLYASDASIFEVRPLAVVRPLHMEDVLACVAYARENHLPVHARGAGSGLAGDSLGRGLVLDFSRHMRRLISDSGSTVRVQPGLPLQLLNRYLQHDRRAFGPDPANAAVTTIGGVISVDAAGSHWLQYRSARHYVESLQVVLADGQVLELSDVPLDGELRIRGAAPFAGTHNLVHILQQHRELIAAQRPRTAVQRAGYRLDDLIEDDALRLARLLAGAEGTLGIITEATLRVVHQPAHAGVMLLLFERLEAAAAAALEIAKLEVSACDLMDRRLLSLAMEADPRYMRLIPSGTESVLLVEKQGDSLQEVRATLQQVVHLVRKRRRLAIDAHLAWEPDERAFYWNLARHVVPSLYRLKGSTRPLPFVEDVAIPPEELPGFLTVVQNLLKKHQTTGSLFAHAAHGQLHLRPFLDMARPEDVSRLRAIAVDLYDEVIRVGGTVSGEHADGMSRSWYLRRQFGPLYDVMREVKRLFDPHHLLNPGKIVTDLTEPPLTELRPLVMSEALAAGDRVGDEEEVEPNGRWRPLLPWSGEELLHAARMCNGCAACRTQSPLERMCPLFRRGPAEESSPRAKANLMRALATGQLPTDLLQSEECKRVADLCVNCHQCRLECPAAVDIPQLMLEAKGQYVAVNGLQPQEWFFTHLDRVARWAGLIRPAANWALSSPSMRWILSRLVGLAASRKLPRLASRPFLARAARTGLTRPSRQPGRKVVYFVDIYANWFDVDLAEAVVRVLEHNGVSVYVPTDQLPSAMAMITAGAVEEARAIATHNVRLLADAVRQGYQVICTEPSAALCLAHEYPHLLDDEDVRLVAKNTREACDYLWRLHRNGELKLDFSPVNVDVGYHVPCHVRALQADQGEPLASAPGVDLLRLVPGVTVSRLEFGCSGMAGTFGLKQANLRSSLRIGRNLIHAIRSPRFQAGATECSSCKIQMEQGTTKPTVHPVKVMAYSYGVMSELEALLTRPSGELRLS